MARFRLAALAFALGTSALGAPPVQILSTPLRPYLPATGPKRFVVLAPEQSGIRTENAYDDPRMWGDLYQESESGSLGTGVAIGDYDNDGKPDIFVVTKTGSCRLFHNLGDYRFEDVTEKAGVADHGPAAKIWKQGVTFVDVNNDGLLDIYVCRFGAPNLLYINQGDGTFKEMAHAYGLDISDASVMASFCDYDRDGLLDVYVATNLLDSVKHPRGQRGYLLHNNGNGTFSDVSASAGISGEAQSHSAIWWDYDNDGWPDLYVANDYGVPDKLYHNQHDGTFANTIDRALRHTSFYSMGSDVADVNNDGLIDLFVADMAATTHRKDQHSIAESRETDRDPDDPQIVPKYRRSALHLATGTSLALEGAYLAGIAASNWTWSVRFEDLDNDGRVDLFVTNGFNRDPNPDVHQRSMEAETTAARIRSMYLSPVLNETHLAYRNLGDLQFQEVGAEWGLDQSGVAFGAAFGDLSGDGNLDIVYSNYQQGVTVMRNQGQTGHRIEVFLRGTRSNRFGVGATVRIETASGGQTRQLWLARGYLSSSEPMLHFGLGADTSVRRLTVEWPSGTKQAFTNLAADQRYTITEPDSRGANLPSARATLFREVSSELGLAVASHEEPVDEVAAQPLLPHRLNRQGPAVATGDIFGDGRTDVVVAGTAVDPLRIFRATAGGTYLPAAAPTRKPDGVDDGPLLLFDARGTGRMDLLVTRGGNSLLDGSPEYRPQLYFNEGAGHFSPAPAGALPDLPISVGAAAAADFAHNGHPGLFLGGRVTPGQYPLPPRSALLINRGFGRFEDVTDQFCPALRTIGMVTGAVWADVDGDGWPDLVLTLEWGGVKYFHNRAGAGFDDRSDQAGFGTAGTGWWSAIAATDLNGDGRPDFVLGNVGLNTQYHADQTHPALLFAGDFSGDGGMELIEASYEGDTIYPWRSRRTLGASIPAVLRRFTHNEDYARASLEEVLGAAALAQAKRFAATELRSGVLLSQPGGGYVFKPLPRLAQIAPIAAIATGEFEGKGQTEVYLAQNDFAPIPSVGHFDGGLSLLLRSDGRGGFLPVAPGESGLLVPGDAKAAVVLDPAHDGHKVIWVTRNNNTALAFRRADP